MGEKKERNTKVLQSPTFSPSTLSCMAQIGEMTKIHQSLLASIPTFSSSTLASMAQLETIAEKYQSAIASIPTFSSSTLASMAQLETIAERYQSAIASIPTFPSSTLSCMAQIGETTKRYQSLLDSIPSSAISTLSGINALDGHIASYQSMLDSIREMDIYPAKPLKIPIKSLFSSETDLENIEQNAKIAYKTDEFDFNKKAYAFLCDLEVSLRHLIQERIVMPYESNLASKIPDIILKSWEEKKKNDSDNEDYRLIDYSDFTDLKIILEKGRNKELFSDLFNHEQYKALIAKLHELDPIRKKIAHFRPLTERELTRLTLYHRDILTIVQKK